MTAREFLNQDLAKPEDDRKYGFASSWTPGHVEAMIQFAEAYCLVQLAEIELAFKAVSRKCAQ